jgi:hypothetical protein
MTDAPAGDAAAEPAATPERRRRFVGVVLPWLVAVLAIAAATYSTIQWRALADERALADSARAAAVGFVRDLTNWDATDGLADEIEVLRSQGTGPFLDEIRFVFGGDELTGQLEADGVSATGEVKEAFVQSVEGDLAEVFTVVSVTYASASVGRPLDPVTFPATLVLQRDGDRWLVREVTVPNSDQISQLMGDTAGARG